MKLPSKIVDCSQPLDNETVVDLDFMRLSIRYVTGKENAALMSELFFGLTEDRLPGGEGLVAGPEPLRSSTEATAPHLR